MAARLRAAQPRNWCSIPVMANDFILHSAQTGSGTHPVCCPMGVGDYILRGKATVVWNDSSPISGVKITNLWTDTSTTPHVFMVSCLYKLRNKFTLCHSRDSCQSMDWLRGLAAIDWFPERVEILLFLSTYIPTMGPTQAVRWIPGLSGRSMGQITSIHCLRSCIFTAVILLHNAARRYKDSLTLYFTMRLEKVI
jgi:hypothetical protein